MQIDSKVTFFKKPDGSTIPMRSRLEARWAHFFTYLGLKWEYEPRTFRLPSGAIYTPDFLIEQVGFIEIKPTLDELLEVRTKLVEFGKHFDTVVTDGATRGFVILCAEEPTWGEDLLVLGWTPRIQKLSRSQVVQAFWSQRVADACANNMRTYMKLVTCALESAAKQRITRCIGELAFEFFEKDFGIPFSVQSNAFRKRFP